MRSHRVPRLAVAAVLVAMWLAATVAYVALLLSGVSATQGHALLRNGVLVAYSAALLWYLVVSAPAIGGLPEFAPILLPNRRSGRLAAALAVAAVFGVTVGLDGGLGLLLLVLLVAAVIVVLAWRRQVTARAVALGVVLSLLAFGSGGLAFWRHGFVAKPVLILMLVMVPPLFVAGGLLVARTGLGASQLLEGRYAQALQGFLRGCLLFVPLGLANAAGQRAQHLPWVTHWWQPPTLPVWSGINEEVVFRLMLVTLCYALLRPAWKERPALAFAAAALFSAVTFGLGHGRTLDNLVFAGLLYGLPFAFVFARRDVEHAVGAHYMVNMIPWVMAFLGK